MGWRTGPFHFASSKAMLYIASSLDDGVTWEKEHEIYLATDVREPYFLEINGRFFFYFIVTGTDPIAF